MKNHLSFSCAAKEKKRIVVEYRKLGRHQADGLAHIEKKRIEIDERLAGKNYLETVIHEVLHIQNPTWSETKVLTRSKELTRVLWEQGFRWVDIHK